VGEKDGLMKIEFDIEYELKNNPFDCFNLSKIEFAEFMTSIQFSSREYITEALLDLKESKSFGKAVLSLAAIKIFELLEQYQKERGNK
jgi:hypothetical protein